MNDDVVPSAHTLRQYLGRLRPKMERTAVIPGYFAAANQVFAVHRAEGCLIAWRPSSDMTRP